jgi:diaminopimelate epimerase
VTIAFSKMHGAGNDVIIVSCLDGDPVSDWEAFARFALDRRLGVGGDQLLLVRPSSTADLFMGVMNPDGSRAEMCANGVRAFYKYARDKDLTQSDQMRIDTLAGIVTPRWLSDDQVEVEMTTPVFDPQKIPTTLHQTGPLLGIPIEVLDQTLHVSVLSMGNPHCVVFVDDPETYPVEEFGRALENHVAFPQRTNVEFVAVRSATRLEQRTWERGTGETLACGSGACAAAVAAMLSKKVARDLEITLRGGILRIRWPADDGPVWMTGPAAHVFDGELDWP